MSSSTKKIKILVVDDHRILRHGLISIFNSVDHFEVVGEAGNGLETLAVLQDYSVDVVLLDIAMPLMNGRESLMHIKKKYPAIKVIMFTLHDDPGLRHYYLESGADGYLVKSADFNTICDTITEVFKLPRSKKINTTITHTLSDEHLQLALNDTEKEIIRLLCQSHNNRTISEALNMSENTVKYHRKIISSKTKTNSLSQLIIYALKQGLVKGN